jgi:hypothetical protein
MSFDFVVAQSLFEYMGDQQDPKSAGIAGILQPHGRLVTSYVNFNHRSNCVPDVSNNVQPREAFRRSLETHAPREPGRPR